MKKIAVVLSGCGVFDGSEIYESTLTLLALHKAGVQPLCTAPNIDQFHVINHLTGEVQEGESRNVLVESARLARGQITPLEDFDPTSADAIIFPGGFGAAKNLSSFAHPSTDFSVPPTIAKFIQTAYEASIPMGFICIAPVIAANILGSTGLKLTIGSDPDTASAIESHGAQHLQCPVNEAIVDTTHKIVTTPAFMLADNMLQAQAGIDQLVQDVLSMT